MNKQNEGLKAYLNLIQQELKLSNERMKEIEKQIEYLDNELPKILEKYRDGEIDLTSFLIYISYVLIGIINDRDILRGFSKFLIIMYDTIRKQS